MSLETEPLDRSYTTVVVELFDVIMTLKCGLEVTRGD